VNLQEPELRQKGLTLEVGCGYSANGDVNIDLFAKISEHRTGKLKTSFPLPVHSIRNFVLADGQHLPFKDEAFDEAHSSHVIEHVPNPSLFLSEMLRVSKIKIVIKCPHKLSEGRSPTKEHINFFNAAWFHNWADKRQLFCGTDITQWRYIPHSYFRLLSWPLELQAIIFKKQNLRIN
jgi:ubiquinone/menaquinone biosynthesis C-methylase UbiE